MEKTDGSKKIGKSIDQVRKEQEADQVSHSPIVTRPEPEAKPEAAKVAKPKTEAKPKLTMKVGDSDSNGWKLMIREKHGEETIDMWQSKNLKRMVVGIAKTDRTGTVIMKGDYNLELAQKTIAEYAKKSVAEKATVKLAAVNPTTEAK
jgi:hypothetical protein